MNLTEAAIRIAYRAHAGKKDWGGTPYILHPLTVAMSQNTQEGFIVGILHDVVEDSDITLDELAAYGFGEEIIEAVDLLTHEKSMDYMSYVKKLSTNELARQVKLADLRHNSDLSRIPELTEKDRKRLEDKYLPALAYLMSLESK